MSKTDDSKKVNMEIATYDSPIGKMPWAMVFGINDEVLARISDRIAQRINLTPVAGGLTRAPVEELFTRIMQHMRANNASAVQIQTASDAFACILHLFGGISEQQVFEKVANPEDELMRLDKIDDGIKTLTIEQLKPKAPQVPSAMTTETVEVAQP